MQLNLNEYQIVLIDQIGVRQDDHIYAYTAQDAADRIRKDWPGCLIQRISLTVWDWR